MIGSKTVGVVYGLPDTSYDTFMLGLESILTLLCTSNIECPIVSDFNNDLLKSDVHFRSDNFLNNLYLHSILPLITRKTRFSANNINHN